MKPEEHEWAGAYYELAVNLGPADGARLVRAATALVRAVELRASLDPDAVLRCHHQRSRLRLPFATQRPLLAPVDVACALVVVRETERHDDDDDDVGDDSHDGDDWLDLCLPLASLARVEHRVGGDPFGDDDGTSLAWRAPLDAWLAGLGRAVFAVAPFQYALIGHEVSGEKLPGNLDAAARYLGVLVPEAGVLRFVPATC